ncbi:MULTISPECIES: DMT family transporter [unclassified Paenibacillus]|uniref:DMT family transporter n=1 Tax=unclassified Paenibacillus TaxID=185978 RepID=UPI001AE63996|nr:MULTISPECIES: DMT family transporter [unclassified Paenibacillus]MBP1155674.1 drug/metabolite transporter (DMT)-like permease [Paenibacillus sp. PvP091]MBP1168940.1 drug/metabolite transporter (DMT)-like permease [Paenibacillus sp. PvR098]MBP2439968.1 drug/metabolite transporter (DMT)-like permease [Paenibacillus sp. PvP052]
MISKPNVHIPLPLLLLVGIVAISFSSIFVRWSNSPVSAIAMYRLVITALIMLPFLWRYRQDIREIGTRDWIGLAWSGLALGLHFLLWMGSLRLTTVASSTAILALEPVIVLIGACLFFHQRTNLLAVLSMLVAITGAILIGYGDWGLTGQALLGDLLSLLGTVAVAIHMLLGKRLLSRIPAFLYSFFVFVFAAAVLALYNLGFGYAFTGYEASEWGIFLLMALVPTLFGHYLFNWLLKFMRPESVSMSVLGEPLGATVLAYLLLGESITWLQTAAGALLLVGVWLFLRSNEKEPTSKLTQSGHARAS